MASSFAVFGCSSRNVGSPGSSADSSGDSTSQASSDVTGTNGTGGKWTDGATTEGSATTSASTGPSSGSGTNGCQPSTQPAELVPPNVVLLVDKSGSMGLQLWEAEQGGAVDEVTHWHSLWVTVNAVVMSHDARVNLGLQLFPSLDAEPVYGSAACLIGTVPEVPVAAGNGAAVLAALPAQDTTEVHGSTPASAGLDSALTHLMTLDEAVPRHVVIMTDGAPACEGPDPLEEYDEDLQYWVADALEVGIQTHVLGIDIEDKVVGCGAEPGPGACGSCLGSATPCDNDGECGANGTCLPVDVLPDGQPLANVWKVLEDVALAGGSLLPAAPHFYTAPDEVGLLPAAQALMDDVACQLVLDPTPTPDQLALTELTLDGQLVSRVDICEDATSEGWRWFEAGPVTRIALCRATCAALVGGAEGEVVMSCG